VTSWVVLLSMVAAAQQGPDGPPNVMPPASGPHVGAPETTGFGDPIGPLATLKGRIVELGSGLPVKGRVTVGEIVVEADAEGAFWLQVPPGDVQVVVESDDHVPTGFSESLKADEVVEVTYRIDRRSWGEEIVVYGEEVREEVSRTVLTAEELRLVPGSFGDPLRALQSLPGVARPATLEGDIVVRGAEALNTGTYVDEIPIPYLFHFFLGRSVVNPALLDDVEFYAGGMPSRFGDVTQAVVNARTLDDRPEPGVHGRVSVDLMDFAASGEGRLSDAWTWQAGYRVSWIGAVIGTTAQAYAVLKGLGDYRPGYPTLAYEDHLLRLAWQQGPDRVVATAIGARDALIFHPPKFDTDGDGDIEEMPLPEDLPYDPYRLMDSGFGRYQLRWDRNIGEHEQVTWLAVGPDTESNLLQGIGVVADGIELGRVSGWNIAARRRDKFTVNGDDAVRAGLDVTVNPVVVQDYSELDDKNEPLRTSDLRTSVGAWGEYQLTLGEETWVAPGFRANTHHFNDGTYFEPEPRVSVRKALPDGERPGKWTATGFVGRFSQVPPIDRYANGIGNPDLTIMSAWQSSVGVEGRYPSGLEIDVSLYASRQANLIVKDTEVTVERRFEPDPENPGGEWSEKAYTVLEPVYRPVTGYAYGVESMVRMRPTNGWFGWVAFTAGKALRVDDDGTVRPGDYDLPLSLVIVGAKELPYAFRLSGRIRATSGYPFTPQYGVYLVDEDHWHGLNGEENGARLPWFRQLDVRVDRTWTAKRARWTVYLDVFNALNTDNMFLATYKPDWSELEKMIWIPIIPTLGLEVSY
jgi:hypothetical protein